MNKKFNLVGNNPYILDSELKKLNINHLKDSNYRLIISVIDNIIDDIQDWDILEEMDGLGDTIDDYDTVEDQAEAILLHVAMSINANKQALIKELVKRENEKENKKNNGKK